MNINPVTDPLQAVQLALSTVASQTVPTGKAADVAVAVAAASTQSVAKNDAQPLVSLQELQNAVDVVRRALPVPAAYGLDFSIDKSTDRTVIRVVDQGTGKVIRQIPSQEMLNIAQAIDHQISLLHKNMV
jgi:flagellar protein FlaG